MAALHELSSSDLEGQVRSPHEYRNMFAGQDRSIKLSTSPFFPKLEFPPRSMWESVPFNDPNSTSPMSTHAFEQDFIPDFIPAWNTFNSFTEAPQAMNIPASQPQQTPQSFSFHYPQRQFVNGQQILDSKAAKFPFLPFETFFYFPSARRAPHSIASTDHGWPYQESSDLSPDIKTDFSLSDQQISSPSSFSTQASFQTPRSSTLASFQPPWSPVHHSRVPGNVTTQHMNYRSTGFAADDKDTNEVHQEKPIDFLNPFTQPPLPLFGYDLGFDSGSSRSQLSLYRRQWELPGTINGVRVKAFPDSGSSRDIVSHEFVKKHFQAHHMVSTSAYDMKIPNGRTVRTLGEIELPFRFEGESEAHVRRFAVLPSCVHDVVLGKTFLRLTRTFTRFKKRLREKLVKCLGNLRMHLMGDSDEQVLGQMNGYLTSACPDTGSDIMAMSSHFAKQRGYHIDDSQANKIQVQFADGSFGRTKGKISKLTWKFGYGMGPVDSFEIDFYVLDELPCDVILSNEFLFDNNVFERFEKYFVQFEGEDEDDGADSFYMIQRVCESLFDKAKKLFKHDPPMCE
jgi:hypothetical protein